MSRRLCSSALVLIFFVFLLPGLPATAQEAPPPPEETTPPPPPPPVVPEGLSTPRATMRTFLQAFDPQFQIPGTNPLDTAASCLDLSDLPQDVRGVSGRTLAEDLKEVLDRTALIVFDEIPDDSDAEPYVIRIHDPEPNVPGVVTLERVTDGRWLVSSATVDTIDEMVARVAQREVVEGVVTEGPRSFSKWLRDKIPDTLRAGGFLLEPWQWLALLVLIVIGLVIDRVFVFLLHVTVGRSVKRALDGAEKEDLEASLRPLGLLAAALFWWPAVTWLSLPPTILATLILAARFIAASSLVWSAYRLVDIAAAFLDQRAATSDSKLDDLLVPLVRKSLKVFIAAFGVIFIADNLHLPIASLLTGVGIGGLAIALAAQDTVRNLFGSITVVLDEPFHVGDWVEIGDIEGVVEEVGFRSTRIRTFYNSVVSLPNSNLISASVDNYGKRQYRRWSTRLGITYDTPADRIEAFCEGVRELIRRHPYTRKDFFEVQLNEFGASSLEIMLYMFFETPDWSTELRERHRLGVDMLRLAQELGVEFAFPTQTLYLKRPEDSEILASDGYGPHVRGVHENAREIARRLVDGALEGKIPPPVGSEGRGEADDE